VVGASEAAERAIWPSADESIMLQALVVLNVFCELTERIARRGAFGATKE
jgi:hypothetical protein